MKTTFCGFWIVGMLLTAIAMTAGADDAKDEAIKKDRKLSTKTQAPQVHVPSASAPCTAASETSSKTLTANKSLMAVSFFTFSTFKSFSRGLCANQLVVAPQARPISQSPVGHCHRTKRHRATDQSWLALAHLRV